MEFYIEDTKRAPAALTTALGLLLLALAGGGCGQGPGDAQESDPAGAAIFRDVAAEAGITHRHRKPLLDSKLDNIMSWMTTVGASVAAADYDRDGWIDLFVTDSHKGEPNRLYRNNGDGTFTDVAPAAGLAAANDERGTSMDAVWGDVDNDGWADLYLVRWGTDSLYRNRGDGTFEEVTERLFSRRDGSAGTQWANGNAALFFDYDRDGRLDLYVGNYFKEVDLWNLVDTRIMHDDFETARNGGVNFLYRQREDGTFEEVAASLGLDDPGWTLAVGSGDVDNDGWADLYCANDFGPDQLFLNLGDGTFANVSEEAIGSDTKKGMNVDLGDFNNDGWLDIYVTNITTAEYLQEGNMLWYNNGPGADGQVSFTDISQEAGPYDGGWGWGAKFFDYDRDTHLDLVAANGFISAGEESYWYDLASWTVNDEDPTNAQQWPAIGDRSFSGYERLRFWQGDGLDSFTERAEAVGLVSDSDNRGIAVVDYDNDGDLDLYIANQGQAPHLFRNDYAGPNHWLGVRLVTDPSTGVNRDGIGTRVSIVFDDETRLMRERDGGNGYSGQSDPRLFFGLSDRDRAAFLAIRWPDGGLQLLEDVEAGQYLTVEQDPAAYVDRMPFEVSAPEQRVRRQAGRIVPEIAPEELERQLADFESRLGIPLDRAMAAAYRERAATYGESDRAIAFLEGLREQHPRNASVAIELALAFVDKMPACGGLAAVVCQGTLARKGLDVLDDVIEAYPDSWLAYYSRAMNLLHWPSGLRKSDDAARDFERCLALQASRAPEPYHELVHLGLGDAYAKDKSFAEARAAYRRGLEAFPDSEALKARLAFTDDGELWEHVKTLRSLEQDLDTDVSFFEGEY